VNEEQNTPLEIDVELLRSAESWSPDSLRVFGQRLRVQALPLCPEIKLWLVGGHVDLNARCPELLAGGYAPFWAFCWGAGLALARYVLDHPQHVRGKRVIDWGAGSGVTAIAAALAGAREVVAVDIDPLALRFISLNAALCGVEVKTALETPEPWDILLASDVLYDESIRDWLLAQVQSGREVLVSDPLRHGMPRIDQEPIASMEAVTVPDVDYPMRRAVIYQLSACV
jgi:predicted nicotinamide N-methyase